MLESNSTHIARNLRKVLWKNTAHVYAILDGARDRRIEPWLNNASCESECLYAGKLVYALKRAAPHLARINPEDSFFSEKLVAHGWSQSWGIYALAKTSDIGVIKRHCRRIAKAKGPAGQKLVFRYYDPRVLRDFLPTCSPEQLAQIFGPIERFVMEGPGGRECYIFYFDAATQRLECEQQLLFTDLRDGSECLK